jgi:hypothetical protein
MATKHSITRSPLGVTAAVERLIEDARADERRMVLREIESGQKVAEPEPGSYYCRGGIVLALQYWKGDEREAMALARILADIEARPRGDVLLAMCRRVDCALSPLAQETIKYCGRKFMVMPVRSTRIGTGHPHGCNQLWAGTMQDLAGMWMAGRLRFESAFTFEADGAPLSRNWIDRLIKAHARTMREGKRITGAVMDSHAFPHVNGNLIAHLSIWFDRPSLHVTPANQPWDMFHGHVLSSECLASNVIRNEYGSSKWTPAALASTARESAWLHGAKDKSALRYAMALAERTKEEGKR